MNIAFPTASRWIKIHVVQMECCSRMCHDSYFLRFHEVSRMSGYFLDLIGLDINNLSCMNPTNPHLALALGVFTIRCTWLSLSQVIRCFLHPFVASRDDSGGKWAFYLASTQVTFPLLWITKESWRKNGLLPFKHILHRLHMDETMLELSKIPSKKIKPFCNQ